MHDLDWSFHETRLTELEAQLDQAFGDSLLPENRDGMSDAEFVLCRDTNSLEYLRSLGVDPPVFEFGPDSTFAFNLRDEEYADRFLAEHRLEPRRFITLTIRSSGQGFIDAEREQAHAENSVRW